MVGGAASLFPRFLLDIVVSIFASSTPTTFPRALEGPVIAAFGLVVGAVAGLAVGRARRYYALSAVAWLAFTAFFAAEAWPMASRLLDDRSTVLGDLVFPFVALTILVISTASAAGAGFFMFGVAWLAARGLEKRPAAGAIVAAFLGLFLMNVTIQSVRSRAVAHDSDHPTDGAWPPCSALGLEQVASRVPGVHRARQSYDVATHQVPGRATTVYIVPERGREGPALVADVDKAFAGVFCYEARVSSAFTGKAKLASPVVYPVTAHLVLRSTADEAAARKVTSRWLSDAFDALPRHDNSPFALGFPLPPLSDPQIVSVTLRHSAPEGQPKLVGHGVESDFIGRGLAEGQYPVLGELTFEVEVAP
jgi:hypothetical protein